jgi:hypothetical protein
MQLPFSEMINNTFMDGKHYAFISVI